MAKTRIVIQLEPKSLAALKKLRAKTGAPVAEIVRRAVDGYLEKYT
jgi:predicted DNA-binding protein